MPFMYSKWLIFSCYFCNFVSTAHFLSKFLSGILAITNHAGDRASAWKIPLRIFISAKNFPSAVNSILPFSLVSSINVMASSDNLYIFWQFIIQL